MHAEFLVRITAAAERDLEELWTYIAADQPEQASRFLLQLESRLLSLERYPLRCSPIPENELLGTGYRHLVHGNYRAIFRVSDHIVYILRIIHGARLLDSSMFEAEV